MTVFYHKGEIFMKKKIRIGRNSFLIILFILVAMVVPIRLKADSEKVLEISTAKELITFANQVSAGVSYEKVTVKLMNDIDLQGSETNVTPMIGDSYHGFAGTFDGQNHKIKNVYILWDKEKASQNAVYYYGTGLFCTLKQSAIVKNLGVTGYISGYNQVGGIAGIVTGKAKIMNCYNEAFIRGNSQVGGIVGTLLDGSGCVINCYNEGKVYAIGNFVGGIVGQIYQNAEVESEYAEVKLCYNVGVVSNENEADNGTASLVGWAKCAKLSYFYNNAEMSGMNKCIGISNDTTITAVEAENNLDTKIMQSSSFLEILNEKVKEIRKEEEEASDWVQSGTYPRFYLSEEQGSEEQQENQTENNEKYSVIYKGGTGAVWMENQVQDADFLKGSSLRLPCNCYQKSGYLFCGWSDGKKLYQPGETYIIGNKNVIFTAIWSKKGLPSPVADFRVKAKTANQIILTWKKQKGIKGYILYQYDIEEKGYKKLKSLKKTVIKSTLKGLQTKTIYRFKLVTYRKESGYILYSTPIYIKVKTR